MIFLYILTQNLKFGHFFAIQAHARRVVEGLHRMQRFHVNNVGADRCVCPKKRKIQPCSKKCGSKKWLRYLQV